MLRDFTDGTIGAAVMVGNHHWKTKPYWMLAIALLLGRHQTIIHLGKRFRFAWWKGVPFLYHVSLA